MWNAESAREHRAKLKLADPIAYKEKMAARNKLWREKNPAEHARRNREWHQANKDVIKGRVLKKKFGIDEDAYSAILAAQDGACKICKNTCVSGRRLAVDHCHSTGKIRGLLCMNCNNALGRAKDSPEILRAMALYLENAL